MKKILIIISLLLSTSNHASMPEYLKDAVITVTLQNGEVHKFSSNEYKVVPRGQAQDIVVTEVESEDRKKRNSAILHAGVGKAGLKVETDALGYKVTQKTAPILGLSLCRELRGDLGLCASGFTNKTFTLGIKKDFK